MNGHHLLYTTYDSLKAMRSEGLASILFCSTSIACFLGPVVECDDSFAEFGAVCHCNSYENEA